MRMLYSGGEHQDLLPFHIVTVGAEHDQEPRRRPDGAAFHHIFVIEKGQGVFETPQGTYTLDAGTVIFIHKDIPVCYYKKGEAFQTGWVTFDGEAVENLLSYFHVAPFSFCKSETTAALIRQCYHQLRRGALAGQLSGVLYEILLTAFGEMQLAHSSPHLVRAKEYMENHFDQDISVSDISGAAGISPSLLYRLFHDEEGTTPVTYLQNIRIRNAKQLLLQHPKMKIAEVAAACGYSDCAYFCKIFKAQEHMTPKNFITKFSLRIIP